MSYYDTTPWGYIHQKRKFKEVIQKLEEPLSKMQRSNEITSEAHNKIKAEFDNLKNDS